MNALYVTVSIPLLLVLAGFNHAHGLTTFGKTPNNNPQPQAPTVQAKTCDNHTSCRGIQGTSCVPEPREPGKRSCLCGDNTAPVNGNCSAEKKAPNHLCTETSQCVANAECKPSNKNGNGQEVEKSCKCMEGFSEMHSLCSGGTNVSILTALIILLVVASRTL